MFKLKYILVIVCFVGLLCSSLHAGSETTYWGIFTGIDEYSAEYGASPLAACVNGANDAYSALRNDSSRWQSSNMTKYTDADATKSAIQSAFSSMAGDMDENDVLLYWQSRHGGQYQDYDTFLCMHDADYTDAEMAEDLEQVPDKVKVVIIIDACNSAGMFKSGNGVRAWNFA